MCTGIAGGVEVTPKALAAAAITFVEEAGTDFVEDAAA
jgi:hypothetical protein